jgi:hypothetical protein
VRQKTAGSQLPIEPPDSERAGVHNDDRVSIKPEGAVESISDQQGRWMSGFQEPGRMPDFYERLIRVKVSGRGEKVTITLRRPLKWPTESISLPALDFTRFFSVDTDRGIRVLTNSYDASQHLPELVRELNALANWHWNKDEAPLPVRTDPDMQRTHCAQMRSKLRSRLNARMKRVRRCLYTNWKHEDIHRRGM